MRRSYNRRDFLRRGAAMLGGLTLTAGLPMAAFAETGSSIEATRRWYALSLTREDGDNACRRHAANKLFADPIAADQHRAHPGCKCQVVVGGELPEHTWAGLFGDSRHVARSQVDRRWNWVATTLA
ncbi:MAG TPA: hypothetical protein VEX37_14245 [Thermomicrobiales bacterium]|nr:hypothetical protein [Thermomicrobiales bacterium]